jgi:hypothetical protein
MADKSDLTVITVVENDNGLLELMIKSVLKFTRPAPRFIICDNANGKNENRIKEAFGNYNNFQIVNNNPILQGGSNRHSDALNKIFPLVETIKTAIIESDCIVLCENWDKIDFSKYKMLAAKKGELAGQPYYHICFLIFSTNLLKHNGIMDFRAGKDENRSNRNYKSHEDVGWRLRDKVYKDQVQLLEFIDCKSNKGKIFDGNFQSDEFWLNGKPLLAHFGRGSNLEGKTVRNGFLSHKDQLAKWKNIALEIIK